MKLRLSKILPRRRWQWWALVAVLLLGVAYLLVPRLAAPYVRGKLQAMVASKLDAELRVGGLTYLPPFGVRVRDAHVVGRESGSGNPVELLKFAQLDLRLAELPFGEGPLVIERIEVRQPEVHLVLTEDGVTGTRPTTPEGEAQPPTTVALPAGTKLSDMFELRHLSVWGGRVVLEDRTRPGSVPMVWSDLNLGTETEPTSKSAYAFKLTADHKGVAAMSATGSFDLDALHVKLDDAQLAIATDPAQPTSALPAQMQDVIRTHRVKGKLGIRATADLSLQHLAAATFDAKLDATGVSAFFPDTGSVLDDVTVVLRCQTVPAKTDPTTRPASGERPAATTAPATGPSAAPAVPAIRVDLERFQIASGPARFSLRGPGGGEPLLLVDRSKNRWTLNKLTGDADFGPVSRTASAKSGVNESNANPRRSGTRGRGQGGGADATTVQQDASDEPTPRRAAAAAAADDDADSRRVRRDAGRRDTPRGDAVPRDTVARDTVSRDSVTRDTVARDAAALDRAPRDVVPRGTSPRDAAPGNAVPRDTVSRAKVARDAVRRAAARNAAARRAAARRDSELPDGRGGDTGRGGLIDRLDLAGRVTFSAAANGPLKPPAGRRMAEVVEYEAVVRPDRLRVRPPKTPLPFDDIGGGTIEIKPGLITLERLTAFYGGDGIVLRAARVPLPDDLAELKDSFSIEEIDCSIDFHRPNRPYPGGFGKVVDRLRPAGVFDIGGGSFFRVARVRPADDGAPPKKPRRSDWFFGVSSDAGSFLLTDKLIPLDDIRGDATVSPMLVDVTRLEGAILGGRGTASGTIMPDDPYLVEGGRVALRDVDLAELARTIDPEDPNDKLVGRAFLNFVFDGALGTDRDEGVTPARALRGRGEFEVIEGHFWTLPVLGNVASEANRDGRGADGGEGGEGGALTLGEAAGVFTVADRTVAFRNAAVNSPALGLIGSGTIGFDQSLDLQIIAAPLGDWRENIKRGRIPVVSDVAAEVVGGIQSLLNAATRTLLYEFRVGGTVSDPAVQAVPAPVLTDPAALLFGRMLDPNRKAKLIDSVRTEPAE